MLKLEIEVKEVAISGSEKRCEVQSSVLGHATHCEIISMAGAMGKAFGELQKDVPELSAALYDAYAGSLKKTLGVDDK